MSQYSNEGTVSSVSVKDFEGNNGWIKLYSFQLQGDRAFYRTGTKDANLQEGDYITFTYEQKGRNNNVDVRSIQKGEGSAAPQQRSAPPAQSKPSARSNSGGGRDDYWKKKEEKDVAKDERYQTVDVPRMSFSAAQDRAVNLVSAALAHDCLSFGNMKKGEKLDYVLECVDQVANKFFVESMESHKRLAVLAESSANSGTQSSRPARSESPEDSEGFDYDE